MITSQTHQNFKIFSPTWRFNRYEGGGYRSPDTCRSRQIDTVTYRLANNTETLVGRGDIHRNP